MSAILRGLDRMAMLLSRAGAALSMAILLAMTTLIILEIGLRLFGLSTFFSVEMVGYGMAAMTFLALGETIRQGGLIKVNVLLQALPGPYRRALGAAVALATLLAFLLPVWAIGRSVATNYALGYKSLTIAAVPLWIPEGLMWAGMLIFWIQLLVHALSLASGGEGVEPSGPGLAGAID